MAISEDEINFCLTCGAPIIKIERHDYFDTATGKQVVSYDYKCPNDRWWKLGHWVKPRYL